MLWRDRGVHFASLRSSCEVQEFTLFNFDSPARLPRSLRGTQFASLRFSGGAAKLNSLRVDFLVELTLLRFPSIWSLTEVRNSLRFVSIRRRGRGFDSPAVSRSSLRFASSLQLTSIHFDSPAVPRCRGAHCASLDFTVEPRNSLGFVRFCSGAAEFKLRWQMGIARFRLSSFLRTDCWKMGSGRFCLSYFLLWWWSTNGRTICLASWFLLPCLFLLERCIVLIWFRTGILTASCVRWGVRES